MRNRSKKGFTLIELLIVIAIIGILAAVLIPQLLRARNVAVDRAAQGYVQNVYTAANAYLSEELTATAADAVAATAGDCATGSTFAQYGTQEPSFSVTSCGVAENGTGTDIVITLVYSGGVDGTDVTLTFP